MKKILLSLFVIASFLGYAFFQKFIDQDEDVKVQAPITTTTASTNRATNIQYKDGTYTGKVADAYYGNLQVQAIITGGKLTDVKFLKYPNDRETSIMINENAMPILKQEAITLQGSSVDIVSGATQTAEAFRQTLQSALDQAS